MSDKISQCLKRADHFDADERFMAIHDLNSELENIQQLDNTKQEQVRNVILKMLDDKNSDVVTIATRCLSIISKKFSSDECKQFVDRLGTLILDPNKAGSRDTWTNGLKTIISATRPEDGKAISAALTGNLLKGLRVERKKGEEENIELEMVCLDILKDLLDRFATEMSVSFEDVMKELNRLLEFPNPELRKRANVTLGSLAASLSEAQFSALMEKVVGNIEKGSKTSHGLYTYIQSVGVISHAAGLRVAPYLSRIVPRLMAFCDLKEGSEEEAPENVLDLWENCLLTFQAIILSCPQEVGPYISDIINLSKIYIKYDPNFAGDGKTGDSEMGADDGWGAGGDDWGGGGGGGDGWTAGPDEQADTRDLTWKVRRGAVGVISAFISVRSDILRDYYNDLLGGIVKRFQERDSNVQEDVLNCCRDLLRESVVADKEESKKDGVPKIVRTRSFNEAVDSNSAEIVLECDRQFKKAKTNVKKAIYAVLRELIIVRSSKKGDLAEYLNVLFPHILEGVKSKEIPLKTDALALLQVMLLLHTQAALEPYFGSITQAICESVSTDGHPQTKADALRVIGCISDKMPNSQANNILQLFKASYSQLSAQDAAEAVRENSITTTCSIVALHGASVLQKNQIADVIRVLITRLDNEVTRIAILKGLTTMAKYPHPNIDFAPVISSDPLEKITAFLRKNQKELKNETAIALEALIRCGADKVSTKAYQQIVKEVSSHISDNDLHLSSLVLSLLDSILDVHPQSESIVTSNEVMQLVYALTKSPLLQGVALKSLIAFYSRAARVSKTISHKALLERISSLVSQNSSRATLEALAQCTAAVVNTRPPAEFSEAVESFIKQVEGKASENEQVVALYTLGELGREHNLSDHKDLDTTLGHALSSSSFNVKQAAAFALGNIAVGNLEKYIGTMLEMIKSRPDDRFLVMGALKETISRHLVNFDAIVTFSPFVDQVFPVLLANAESKDEGPRNLVAECLGKLSIISPQAVLPKLEELAASSSPLNRAVVITAVRFAIAKEADVNLLKKSIPTYLGLVKDKELSIRHQAVLTINGVARSNIGLIEHHLPDIVLPVLYSETEVKKDLIEIKDFGNFTETVDHGFPMRLAVFQCLETLLELAAHKIDKKPFIQAIAKGLEEKSHLIQLRTYNMLYTLAEHHSHALLESLEGLYDPLLNGAKARIKDVGNPANPKAKEEATDVLTACVRTVFRVIKLHGVEQCPNFVKFHRLLLATKSIAGIVAEVTANTK